MPVGLLGRKVGMTQVFDDKGEMVGVTVLQVGPCTVLQVRDQETDGYHALQLGYADKSRERARKTERGHVARIESKRNKARQAAGVTLAAKANCEPKKFIREFRLETPATQQVGDNLLVDIFEKVKAVDVIGMTKGRGTTGVMKRHNFSGLGASHGVKRHHRAPGSLGAHATDRGNSGKMKKGKRMAGRYGNERVTIRNLKVIRIDKDNNLLLVEGAVPGANQGFIIVRPTNKKTKAGAAVKK
jgi:large subunit ribosomal protein L3